MLVIRRSAGQTILIGDDIVITLVRSRFCNAKIGIDAPQYLGIERGEAMPDPTLPRSRVGPVELLHSIGAKLAVVEELEQQLRESLPELDHDGVTDLIYNLMPPKRLSDSSPEDIDDLIAATVARLGHAAMVPPEPTGAES